MKRMRMGMVLTALAALGVPAPGSSQEVVRGEFECPEGAAKGDLGISGLDCRGDCTLTMNEKGEEQAWSFTVEPRVNGITPGGPAEGVLRAGDLLVAIDGVLITTREGGIRYANVKPGQEVAIRFRRDGRLANVTIRAGSVCPPPPPRLLSPAPLLPPVEPLATDTPPPPPRRAVTVGRLVSPPQPDTVRSLRRAVGIAVAPRVVVATNVDTVNVARERAGRSVVGSSGVRGRSSLGLLSGPSPTGRIGIGFQCTECGTRTDEETGDTVWFFSGPIEVTAVNNGGPADKAGVQIGDLITAIDGFATETAEGGRAFSEIEPGETVRLTIVKRSGREQTVRVEAQEAEAPLRARAVARAAGETVAAEPVPPSRRVVAAAPSPPAGVAVPVLVGVPEAPAGMPLRYSGTVGGVEVEVRGVPANVMEFGGARIIVIQAEGVWIRIRIPSGEGEVEITPLIR